MEERNRGGAAPGAPGGRDRERLVNRVVVARKDGIRLKGFVYDFSAREDRFHLFATDDPAEKASDTLRVSECKAIYFVRSHTGNPHYREDKEAMPEKRKFGRPFEIEFQDGERLRGTVEFYNAEKPGFYLFPPDPRSNNLRIFIVRSACRTIRLLDGTETSGDAAEWTAPDPSRYPMEKRVEVVLRVVRGDDPGDLSIELSLPVPVIEHWHGAFLAGGRASLTDEALAQRAFVADPSAPPGRPDRTPVDRRVEAVVRTLARQDEAVVSQVFLAPLHRISEWRDAFMDAGRMAVRGQAADEASQDPDLLRERYEQIVIRATSESRDRDDLLDSLADILGGDPPKGP